MQDVGKAFGMWLVHLCLNFIYRVRQSPDGLFSVQRSFKYPAAQRASTVVGKQNFLHTVAQLVSRISYFDVRCAR